MNRLLFAHLVLFWSLVAGRRIIAIADIHGSYIGLLDILFSSQISSCETCCDWDGPMGSNNLLVQLGDIVDRGPQAQDAFDCLRQLQSTASIVNSKLVRLIGSKIYRK